MGNFASRVSFKPKAAKFEEDLRRKLSERRIELEDPEVKKLRNGVNGNSQNPAHESVPLGGQAIPIDRPRVDNFWKPEWEK